MVLSDFCLWYSCPGRIPIFLSEASIEQNTCEAMRGHPEINLQSSFYRFLITFFLHQVLPFGESQNLKEKSV